MKKVTLVVASGDMDKLYSAFIIGTGALSMGMEVSMYFTFWGLSRLQKGGLNKGGLSRMNFLGLGKRMMQGRMRKSNVRSLDGLLKDYKALGGKIIACDMTMDIMGISKEDLEEGIADEFGAVGTYLNEAKESDITLFI
ncbi:MAG: DsrE/DsrF/DrsH-like family protein [Candidatus Methanofastidiosia archaeon]